MYGLHVLKLKPDLPLMRVTEFASTLAQCKTPEEVSKALAAATLPAGSYRTKRRDEMNRPAPAWFGVNAYIGAGWSDVDAAGGENDDLGHSLGIEAPIGFEFAHGCRQFLVIRSFSIVVTALNPGKLLQVYHGSDSTTTGPEETRLRDIVAPGIYLSLGVGEKVPLSFCAGYEFAAGFRREPATGDRVDVNRFILMLGLDMPLLRF
jgi:hypothetical protein